MFHLFVLKCVPNQEAGHDIFFFTQATHCFTHRTFYTMTEQNIAVERIVDRIRRYKRLLPSVYQIKHSLINNSHTYDRMIILFW